MFALGPTRRHNRRQNRRHNPRHYHHVYRRRRRNPGMSEIFGPGTFELMSGGVVGFLSARMIPASFLQAYNSGITGYALNAIAGGAVSWVLGKFWNRQAGVGGMVGTAIAVVARVITDNFSTVGATQSLSGDLDFDLGYYVSDRFPFPQDTGGPFQAFPGTPYLSNPPFPTTSAAAVRAGAAAAAALPATATAPAVAEAAGRRWDNSRWS